LKVQSEKNQMFNRLQKNLKLVIKNLKSDEKSMLFLNKTSMLRFADFQKKKKIRKLTFQ